MADATDIIKSIKDFSDIQDIIPPDPKPPRIAAANMTPPNAYNGKSAHFSRALEQQIKIHITPLVNQLRALTLPEIDDYSKLTLLCMLCNLECFSDEMLMSFCSTHYFGEPPSGEKYRPNSFTTQFALNAILQQVEIDSTVFAGIARDRLNNILGIPYAKLDAIANNMIGSAVDQGWFASEPSHIYETPFNIHPDATAEPRPVPLTHFGGSSLRMIPYSPAVPISLPIDLLATGFSDEEVEIWMKPAIAYEVGRLVFWKGSLADPHAQLPSYHQRVKFSRLLGLRMQTELGISKWVANGVAGIFADVFMTLYCGLPALGYAIRRAQPRKLDRFQGEDLRYQLPTALRPFVCLRVLKKMTSINSEDLKLLEDEWEDCFKRVYGKPQRKSVDNTDDITDIYDPPLNATIYNDYGTTSIGFKEAKAEVERATDFIYELMKDLKNTTTSSLPSPLHFGEWKDGKVWMKFVQLAVGDPQPDVPGNLPNNLTPADLPLKDAFFLEGWFSILSNETITVINHAYLKGAIDDATYNDYYRGQRAHWSTALYSGGWMMESPGNTGGPH